MPRSKLLMVALVSALSHGALAYDDHTYENPSNGIADYKELALSLRPGAESGDAEKQEQLADLFLGPHAQQARATPYEGIQFLFRAAVNGRPAAMRRLGDALKRGLFGLSTYPRAAQCWSATPANFEGRLDCVNQTDFDDPRARVPCTALTAMGEEESPETRNGVAMARLCLANKTPAILVPGLPPSRKDLARVREYKRHGIEWSITGDVYDEQFETFRQTFNQTIVAALDAKHGPGYLDRLSKEIEVRVSRK